MMCIRSVCVTYILYCVLIFFFFFKQKTAYEMRISDWSSDVCSSDLISVPRQEVERNSLHSGANRLKTRLFPAIDRGSTQERMHEIGRASCRERVCQYV